MIGQMVTEIASEAKAGHFAGLIPVILPLLDGESSHRNGTTGDPNESPHPVVNRTLHVACMQNACGKLLRCGCSGIGDSLMVRMHRYVDVGIHERLRACEILRCDADDGEV